MNRRFIVAPDRVVVLPREVLTGPGAGNARFVAGEVLELTAAAARHRYVRNRLALGDLVEQPALPERITKPAVFAAGAPRKD